MRRVRLLYARVARKVSGLGDGNVMLWSPRTVLRWCIVLAALISLLSLPLYGLAHPKAEPHASLTLSPSSGPPGTEVTALVSDYPNECGNSFELLWDNDEVLARKDVGDRSFSITFTVPDDDAGPHTVRSSCGGATATFDVEIPLIFPGEPSPAVPPAAPPPPAPGSALALYEEIIRRELNRGVILYNPPEQMRVGETDRVEVRITRQLSDALSTGLQGQGTPQIEALRVGTLMRATLEGSAFDIQLIGSDIQQLPAEGFREWRWEVRPTTSGNHPLFVIVSVLYEDTTIEEKVFERRIDVAVNPPYSIKRWLASNWEKALAALGVIVSLIEAYRRLRHKRAGE